LIGVERFELRIVVLKDALMNLRPVAFGDEFEIRIDVCITT